MQVCSGCVSYRADVLCKKHAGRDLTGLSRLPDSNGGGQTSMVGTDRQRWWGTDSDGGDRQRAMRGNRRRWQVTASVQLNTWIPSL